MKRTRPLLALLILPALPACAEAMAAEAALGEHDGVAALGGAAQPAEPPPLPPGAPPPGPPPFDCPPPALRAEALAAYDGDGDGQLDDAERMAMAEDLGAPPPPPAPPAGPPPPQGGPPDLLGFIYDADENRSLDEAERLGLEDDHAIRCAVRTARLLHEFDDDGSGALSLAELAASLAALRQHLEEQRAQEEAAMDTDGDGAVAPEEAHAFFEEKQAAFEATVDDDGDGELSFAERGALRELLRQRVRHDDPLPPPPPAPPQQQ